MHETLICTATSSHHSLASRQTLIMARLNLITALLTLLTLLVASGITSIVTHYAGNLPGGNCMFPSYSLPASTYGTAIAGPNWNSAALCGACLHVAGPSGNSIKAMVSPTLTAFIKGFYLIWSEKGRGPMSQLSEKPT